jgi:hypothetical protein
MTGFESKRQAAQRKLELADAYALAVAATPHMPTPLERKLAVVRMERARNALEAALEQPEQEPVAVVIHAAWSAGFIEGEKAALAQPVQEPVAWVKVKMTGGNVGIATIIHEIYDPFRERLQAGDKLYTTPPAAQPEQRKPLTDEEIQQVVLTAHGNQDWTLVFARAIEAAHGIKEKT